MRPAYVLATSTDRLRGHCEEIGNENHVPTRPVPRQQKLTGVGDAPGAFAHADVLRKVRPKERCLRRCPRHGIVLSRVTSLPGAVRCRDMYRPWAGQISASPRKAIQPAQRALAGSGVVAVMEDATLSSDLQTTRRTPAKRPALGCVRAQSDVAKHSSSADWIVA